MARQRFTSAAAIGVVLGCLSLGACGTVSKGAPQPPATCLPLPSYGADQEHAQAAALRALPANSPLIGAIADYGRMRAADRACLSAAAGH